MYRDVLYVSVGSKVRPRTFRCVAMGSAVFIYFEAQIALIFAGSGFIVRLLCFVQTKTLCMYALVLVCVDMMVVSSM